MFNSHSNASSFQILHAELNLLGIIMLIIIIVVSARDRDPLASVCCLSLPV
jgi:hypothetical protein